jgi:hypothetical protein
MYHPAFVLICCWVTAISPGAADSRQLTSSADSHCILIRQVH